MTTIAQRLFFDLDGKQVYLFTLDNGTMQADVTNYGGILNGVRVPDKNGKIDDVVLGFDTKEGILSRKYFLGTIVGRCANRVRDGKAVVGGKTVQLTQNRPPFHIHGGFLGFDKKLWDAKIIDVPEGQALELRCVSQDGEEGYPGRMQVKVVYGLTEDNRLSISYEASADKDTLCNLTNHVYLNLAGHDAGEITGHILRLEADGFTETDESSIPTGRMLPVDGTPMDFRQPHTLGERIDADYDQLRMAGGYDHSYILNHAPNQLGLCAEVWEPVSGRTLTCYTTSPCVQLYTGNSLDGSQPGKGGVLYQKRCGFCLETQYAPNAEEHPAGQSSVLKRGEVFRHTTVFAFGSRL